MSASEENQVMAVEVHEDLEQQQAKDERLTDRLRRKSSVAEQVDEVMGVEETPNDADWPMSKRILVTCAKTCIVLFLLWLFLAGLELMGTAFKVLGGKDAAKMFDFASNPIAGLMIGVFATVLVQSSSTTTSIVVSLVAAEAMTVTTAVPIIMGANIGTSVTNTLVSLVHAHDPNEFKRAFAGATVHDFFNILNVIVFLPLEAATGMFEAMTGAMVGGLSAGGKFTSPTKRIVSPFVAEFLKADKDKIKLISLCNGFEEGDEDWMENNCDTDRDGKLAKAGFLADLNDGAAGALALIISLVFVVVALMCLVKVLNHTMKGRSAGLIKKALNMNSFFAMCLGAAVTILVQSSSITTSTLVPLVGVGAVTVEKMFPFTLGANVGTTVTALLAAISSGKEAGMQIALCHLFFNIFGIIVWFPLPITRGIPIFYAKQLGVAVARRRAVGLYYTVIMFFVAPAVFLGLSMAGDAVVLAIGIPILLAGIGFSAFLYLRENHPDKVPEVCCAYFQPREGGMHYDDEIVNEDDACEMDDMKKKRDLAQETTQNERSNSQSAAEEAPGVVVQL